jgi:glycosyltransferase involved in cell wall biosynthesis
VSKTVEICKREKVDVWHAHDYKTNLLGLLVKRKWPMRMVSTVHGWVELTLRTRLYHFLDRLTLPRYEKIACVSPDLLETCRKNGVREDRSFLIENAIDTKQFRRRQTRVEAKRKLGLPESQMLIGAVGRLSPEKGFDRLIGVVKALHSKGIRPRLAIIGDGGQRDQLQSMIDQHGLSDYVQLAGFQKNPTQWYEAMDVFVLSSLREGLPNVVLEAMALETPVVTTAVAGVPRLIENDVSGIVVPIANDSALEVAIAKTLVDDELRKRLADAGRKVIESRYGFKARMRKVADLYRSLLPS